MPADLNELPELLLVGWAAGLAVAAGLVAIARLVGAGFTWLTVAVSALLGLVGALGQGTLWGRLGLLLLAVAAIWARRSRLAGACQLAAGLVFMVGTAHLGGWVPASVAALALGGVTGEMLLSHWYLIDPSLPRWSLRALAIAAILGIAANSVVLAAEGLPDGGATFAFWVLMATSAVLMLAVVAALRYPAYSGVMSATGLSYLALLTTAGGVFLGWVLVAGLIPTS